MQPDILYEAAVKYARLRYVAYEIILGRKGKTFELILHFPYESFFHLVGMQHLEDLTFPSSNKERIFKDIIEGKLKIEDLKKSKNYDKWHVEERIGNLYLIEDILENNKVLYKINPRLYAQYTQIFADYLLEYKDIDILYLFVVKERDYPKFENEHKGCSFFKKYHTDYTRGTAKTTLLLMNKIEHFNLEYETKTEIYRSASYKPTGENTEEQSQTSEQ